MAQSVYSYIREVWKSPSKEMLHSRLIQWRATDSIVEVERPLRLDRARSLGYKAKKGIIVFRVRVKRGGRKRTRKGVKGRKSRKQTNKKVLKMNYQWVAEIRAARKYPELEVLNSYKIGKDGKYYFFEVIMVDPTKSEIKNDASLAWMANPSNRKRAERGLTSAARKSRGLRSKSDNMKVRPSLRSWNRVGK